MSLARNISLFFQFGSSLREKTPKIEKNVENHQIFANFEIFSHVTLVEIDKKRDVTSLK